MTLQRRVSRTSYTDREKDVLVTGIPCYPGDNRFGHPLQRHGGWDREEIQIAWDAIGSELLELWQSEKYTHYRKRYGRPFAQRFLEQDQDHGYLW